MRLGSLFRRLNPRSEDGIALVLALTIMVFAAATTTTAIYMTTSSETTSNGSAAQQDAYALAEAGLNDALAVLDGQLNDDGSIKTGAVDPRSATLFSTPVTEQYPNLGGSVTYSGTIDTATYIWTITSIGKVAQQDSSTPVTRKLTQQVNVVGIDAGANGGSWSRFYADTTTGCLNIDNYNVFVTNIATRGNLCLTGNGAITPIDSSHPINVDVGGNITITGAATSTAAKAPTAATGWTSPSSVYASDNVYTTNAIAATSTSGNLDITGFGAAIPATASVNGVTVAVQRHASAVNEVETISQSGTQTGAAFSLTVCGTHTSRTTLIAYTASGSTIASAINAVCGTNYVSSCSGTTLHNATITCTFSGTTNVTQMSIDTYTPSTWSSRPTFATTQSGGAVTISDQTVQLLKAGSPAGNNKASASLWPTADGNATYGTSTDLWGTTWTPADVNASNFGVRIAAKNSAAIAQTASIDDVTLTVSYTPVPPGIGTAALPVNQLNVGGTCQLNTNAAHSPCTTADDTYATTPTVEPAADNPALVMPTVDFSYWYQNAKPGPMHFCTNPNPGITSAFFDNDTTLNGSLTLNGEMAGNSQSGTNWTHDTNTPNTDYDCEVWSGGGTSGTLEGEITWNHTTHVMNIYGTVFIDGSFRFDNDGEVVHYFGRGDLMSSKEDEIDAVVCAGGTGTTDATSCLQNMSSWSPSTNMMVLMSDTAASWNNHDSDQYDEYDQGGSTCSGSMPTCDNGHTPGGYQGIMYSNGECWIHQNFQDSGPVICNSILLSDPEGTFPTFFTFPSIGNLTNGQTYSGTANANNFAIQAGQQSG